MIKLVIYTLIFSLATFTHYTFPATVFAVDSTQSAKTASSSSLLEKINLLKQEVASKAAALKPNVNQRLENKFYWGKIISNNLDSISLSTKIGTKFANTNEFTEYATVKGKATAKDMRTDDYIVALGDIDDKGNLAAKRVIKIAEPKQDKQTFWGQVKKITGNNLILKAKKEDISVVLDPEVAFFYGNQEASSSAMGINSQVIVTGYQTGKVINSSYVYIIPQGAMISKQLSPIPSVSPKK